MQIPRKHFPAVGLLSLVLVGAAAGSIYYYQFVVPQNRSCVPAHRVIFLDAIIEELGGFTIKNAAYLNQTDLPSYSNQTGPILNSTVAYTNYRVSSNKTIEANLGDTVTIFYHSKDASPDSRQQVVDLGGHGFFLGDPFNVREDVIPWGSRSFGDWWSVTFTVGQTGSFTFRCNNQCSPEHGNMTGSLSVSGCG